MSNSIYFVIIITFVRYNSRGNFKTSVKWATHDTGFEITSLVHCVFLQCSLRFHLKFRLLSIDNNDEVISKLVRNYL